MLMYIGAYGWEHQQWQGSFYEPGLPDDWHLTFYAKRFNTVLVPYDYWTHCSVAQIEEICSDVEENYPIIFEVKAEETDSRVVELLSNVDSHIRSKACIAEDSRARQTAIYRLQQLQILQADNLFNGKVEAFLLTTDTALKDVFLREIISGLKKEFSDCDAIYLYFAGELINIDAINTGYTLLKHLALSNYPS